MNYEKLEQKVLDATARFLERRGMEILDKEYDCAFGYMDVIARDEDGVIRFVRCTARRWALPDDEPADRYSRSTLERIAIEWLDAHPDVSDSSVTFDVIDFAIFGENYNRALLRHYRNVLELPDAAFQPEK